MIDDIITSRRECMVDGIVTSKRECMSTYM